MAYLRTGRYREIFTFFYISPFSIYRIRKGDFLPQVLTNFRTTSITGRVALDRKHDI